MCAADLAHYSGRFYVADQQDTGLAHVADQQDKIAQGQNRLLRKPERLERQAAAASPTRSSLRSPFSCSFEGERAPVALSFRLFREGGRASVALSFHLWVRVEVTVYVKAERAAICLQ